MAQPTLLLSYILFYVTMAIFTGIGLWAGRRGVKDTDTFLTARDTQNWVSLGTNFFAAGLGVWCFFALPEVGSDAGLLGVCAYSISIVIPILILGWIGPVLRKRIPEGVTLTEFILARFGWFAHAISNLIAILYMSVFLVSELTALGFLLATYEMNVFVAQIVVCASTAVYTCLSGMQASLITDKFQGWIVLILMVIVSVAFGLNVEIQSDKIESSELLRPSRIAWESLYTLIVANLSANIFHQGYWQRVYSAKNDQHLMKASIFASVLSFPVIFLIGITGVLSVWAGLSDRNDPLAFFKVTKTLPSWVNGFVLILATAFVSSSVDTLQNGISATIVNDLFLNKVPLNIARMISVLINIPVLAFTAKEYNIVSLFLIADLAAAIVVCPVLFGLLFGDMRRNDQSEVDEQGSFGTKFYMNEDEITRPPFLKTAENLKSNRTLNFSSLPSSTSTSIATTISHHPNVIDMTKRNDTSDTQGTTANGLDFCFGVLGGLFSVVIFGLIFSEGDIVYAFMLLSLPNGLSTPGESLGAFIAAPLGSLIFFFCSMIMRKFCFKLFPTLKSLFKDPLHLFNGTKMP